MVNVRHGVIEDGQELIRLAHLMHEESPRFQSHHFSIEKIGNLIIHLINTQGAIVAETEGKLIGMLGGFIGEDFFGPDKVASDLVVYIEPEHRTANVAVRMIRMFEDWAIANGATEICLGISTGINTERTAMLYDRLGFKQIAVTTVKRV